MHTQRSNAVALTGALVLGTLLTFGTGIAQADESQLDSSEDTLPGAKIVDLGDAGRAALGTAAKVF
jgi:hypothetical protein